MTGLATGDMSDLLATAEAVGHNQRLLGRRSNGWEKDSLADLERYQIVRLVEPKRPSHAAAAGIGNVGVQSNDSQGTGR